VSEVVRILSGPDRWEVGVISCCHDGLAEIEIAAPGESDTNAIHFEAMKTVDARADDTLFLPASQPVRSGAVEEIVFACSLPNEMPRVSWVNANGTAPVIVTKQV
jgi:hypothetical protein